MNAALIVAARMRRIERRFVQAGALSAETARRPGEVGAGDDRFLRRMVRQGILIEVEPGRYYVDQDRSDEISGRRRFLLIIAAAAALIGFLIATQLGVL